MDPNYFFIEWPRVGEVLGAVVIFAFILERALAPLFESRFFLNRYGKRSLKETIAVLLGVAVCYFWKLDALSIVVPLEKTTWFGYIITGATIAGGSKASLKLFKDVLGVKSTRQAEEDEGKAGGETPDTPTEPVA
jgi:hypothetical protein